jgi:hypothetical protein
VAKAKALCVRDLQSRAAFLLDVPLRVHDLFRLHGRKLLGHDLQWHQLDVPGLRSDPQFRK